uniref:Retrovirus-related Pol polyprotein from transposon TNT 1-94 n=1 Tax=Cajanus cajan TaxID=3821 RepID=A0A151SA75_CAJCA|nr:hypothetical protein KK1_026470 [Cajanus cajan]
MHPFVGLSKDESGELVEQTIYRGMIRSLLYLTASRLDIMFNVYLYARFQSDPKKSYLKFFKRIFIYLASTTKLSLFYERTNNFRLVEFC